MISKPYHTITACRICGHEKLTPILDLGNQPPANSLRTQANMTLPLFPLVLCRCPCCTTVQLNVTVSPEYLFSNYVWVTGTSEAAQHYSTVFHAELEKRMTVKKGFVIEVASNDGTFLKRFKDSGHTVLGIDPATNIAKQANDNGIPTMNRFFSIRLAKQLLKKKGRADCVYARNVIPHVEDVHDVLGGMKQCLKNDGVGAIEFHASEVILEELHYDSVYHEHLCYHSIESISHLLSRHGLNAFDLTKSPISGGSYVIYFSKEKREISETLGQKRLSESLSGTGTHEKWSAFARACTIHKEKLKQMIDQEMAGGKKLIGYGASARSSTLLNFCGIDKHQLTCIADQNPIKHDKITPGTDIPIVAPSKAFGEKPDVVVLLAWNFKNEILAILNKKFQFKGKIIQPLPNMPIPLEMK